MPQHSLRTRFAPSPTGFMHVGNAFSALQCQQWANTHQAELILRIEDIDFTRCRSNYIQSIYDDLQWLGIHWQREVIKQSERLSLYQQALVKLRNQGLIYPCFCTRKHIQEEISRIASAPHSSQEHDSYPGICRHLSADEQQQRMQNEPFAWRIHIQQAAQHIKEELFWQEGQRQHRVHISALGDFVIARKDIGISYHLAVVVDDAKQGISHIIRGEDLRDSTPIHRLLQALLGLPAPTYQHHRLLRDSQGKRLAKRNQSTTLKSLREAGLNSHILRQFLAQGSCTWPFKDHHEPVWITQQLGSSGEIDHHTPHQ